ncbi:hypothetical protein [Acidianus sp. HS-5]|uniref:hypothetical protein n=1 Tax=Acidianus sp. HS-5 TaxID=2886040 RepID=UPI001F1C6BA1|nr:hypothetical protein [Acidianus sp. HS-5]
MLGKIGELLLILNEYSVALFYLTYVTVSHLSFVLSLITALLIYLILFIFVVVFVSKVFPKNTTPSLISGKIVEAKKVHYQIISFQASNVIPFVLASYNDTVTLVIGWVMLFLFIVLSYNDVSILALNPYLILRRYNLYLVKVESPQVSESPTYNEYYIFSRDDLEVELGLELDETHLYEIDNNLYIMSRTDEERKKITNPHN